MFRRACLPMLTSWQWLTNIKTEQRTQSFVQHDPNNNKSSLRANGYSGYNRDTAFCRAPITVRLLMTPGITQTAMLWAGHSQICFSFLFFFGVLMCSLFWLCYVASACLLVFCRWEQEVQVWLNWVHLTSFPLYSVLNFTKQRQKTS